jgi:hypothetical protein
MNQFKRKKVIMLPTVESQGDFSKERLYPCILKYSWMFDKNQKGKLTFVNCNIRTPTQLQHLYIISDDEIKEGNYVYDSYKDSVYQATKVVIHNMKSLDYKQYLNKIVATTDTSLTEDKRTIITGLMGKPNILPQPSQQFIEKYIESYNKDEVITDVLVEYSPSSITLQTYSGQQVDDNLKALTLKTNSKDNTITITKLKDSWSREEVIELINQYTIEMASEIKNYHRDKWISDNL